MQTKLLTNDQGKAIPEMLRTATKGSVTRYDKTVCTLDASIRHVMVTH